MKKILHYILLTISCFSCKEDNIFDESPSQRTEIHIKALKQELVNAPHGWLMTYFPKTDSLLFSNLEENISSYDYKNISGYGGYCFTLKFYENGTVESTADFDSESMTKSIVSEYAIGQNSYTQLSFTTYSYIHRLVNNKFSGSSDFLYYGKNEKGDLIFKTASYIEPAREFIVFTKLKSEEKDTNELVKSYDNTLFFRKMKSPRLVIRKADRILFKSDMRKRMANGDEDVRRYHLFLFAKEPPYIPDEFPPKVVGLGSGYIGTPLGLSFRAGIRYNSRYIFYDFMREKDRFICELVKVYDSYNQTEYLTSKHLEPNGEPTGIVAEIYDDPSINI